MKKNILLFSVILLNGFSMFAQQFAPGYYIINNDAEYSVALPSGIDFRTNNKVMPEQLQMSAGEVVIAFEESQGKYYCFDPNGRMVVFQGQNCLTKAPQIKDSGVGYMLETILLLDGTKLAKGSYFWIIGQDVANSTIKIQVQNEKTYDIPQSKIALYSVIVKNSMKSETYRKVH